jgi:hypothetical protein
MTGRVVRLFLFSIFRNFCEERNLLVRKGFPTLRARLHIRFFDPVHVDLCWGGDPQKVLYRLRSIEV